jgi:CRISP-associated protein Cas1
MSSGSVSLDRIANPVLLQAVWDDLLREDGRDGVLGSGVTRFAQTAAEQLADVAERLAAGTYEPGLLTAVPIVDPDGGARALHIPSVRDRIVERAVLSVIGPVVDPWLGPSSFAYRPGLGVVDAVQTVARLRDEGLSWVARTDIDECFPSISAHRVQRLYRALLDDDQVCRLLDALLVRPVRGSPRGCPGLAQGAPLSPLWANLVLAGLDLAISRAGFPVVRYSDDLVIAASSRDEAWEAMRVARDAAADAGLRLGADKSDVMSFADGFTFLGEDFGPRYPPRLDVRVETPDRRVLYLGRQGSRVRVGNGRVVVETGDDQELLDVASGLVGRIVTFGAVGVSAGVRSWALTHDVDLVFLSRRGTYLGHAWPAASGSRVLRLRSQLAASADPGRRLAFGQAVVQAKLRKQLVLLQRFNRRESAEVASRAVGQIGALLPMVARAAQVDELMGVEGAAAREYFSAFGEMVPEEVRFVGRSRRPPEDVINAALSYGYAILLGECVSALCAAGLDPAVGFLHADDDRRPSLALDLMEEFRPMIVDQVVMSAARASQLRAEHGRRDEGVPGVLLTKAGRQVVIDGYERRMLQRTRGALPGFAGTLRRHLYRQSERVAAFVLHENGDFSGLSWR